MQLSFGLVRRSYNPLAAFGSKVVWKGRKCPALRGYGKDASANYKPKKTSAPEGLNQVILKVGGFD